MRGFTVGGGTKKEAKKRKQQEVKEKTIRRERKVGMVDIGNKLSGARGKQEDVG